MASVTKSRVITGSYTTFDTYDKASQVNTLSLTESITGPRKGPGSCVHISPGIMSGVFQYSANPSFISYSSYPFTANLLRISIPSDSQDSLNWEKLPSSSSFGLLQILAELDETIGMFAKNMYRQLSYGKFTWGVLPFVSDLKAILEAIKSVGTSLSDIPYEDAYQRTGVVRFSRILPTVDGNISQYFEAAYKVSYRYAGVLDLSFQNSASILLDRLGFHPDLATAWDLIPFSFVVDYLLPVGDFLESLRGGGWVKAAIFRGWSSLKTEITELKQFDSQYSRGVSVLSKPYKAYNRDIRTAILTVPPADFSVELQAPSIKEMINMAYLAGLFEVRFKL